MVSVVSGSYGDVVFLCGGGLISVVVWWWVLLITGLNNSCGVLWGQCFWVLCGRGGNGVTGIRVRWEMGNMGNKEMVNL